MVSLPRFCSARSRRVALASATLFAVAAVCAADFPAKGRIELAFTPGEEASALIAAAIYAARQSVLVQAFSFTNKSIARALARTARRGVAVSVLVDRGQFERGNAYLVDDLKRAGVKVLLDGAHEAAHNKVIVIDPAAADGVVITGSFNFTQAAQNRNAENVLLLRGNPELAQAYADNWSRHRAHATPLD